MPLGRFRLLVLITFLFAGISALCADMPPISEEDQKLTAVPGVPGAAAAVLFREEIFDDIRHAARIQARVKILTDEGRKYADVSIPYDRKNLDLTAISGRTIHPDGKIIPFDGKPFDKVMFRGKDIRYNVKTFTLPDVQVGSIIEYKYTLIYPDRMLYPPRWVVQDTLWQKQVHFRFYMYPKEVETEHGQLARGVSYTISLPKSMNPPKEIDPPNNEVFFELNATNVEPFIDEPYMPDSDQFKYNVRFYYRASDSPKEFWKNASKYWDHDVDKFLGKKDGVAEVVAANTAPSDTPDQKSRKLYAFVTSLDNEDFLPARTEQEIKTLNVKSVTGVADVLRQKRGDSEEITRTFVALARAAGLKAYVMCVTDRENNYYDPNFLETRQLDDEIAIVEIDGKDVFLDPGAKFSRYGLLDWRHTMTAGYRQTADKPVFAQTPNPTYKDAGIQRAARLNVKPDFTIDGPMRIDYFGFIAASHRQAASKTDAEGRKKMLEDEVKSWLPAEAEVKLANEPNWNEIEAPLTAQFRISAPVASNAGKRVLYPAHVFHFTQKPMFPHAQRVNGIYFFYPSRETDDIRFTIPPNLAVESLPQKDTVQLQYAIYKTEYVGKGDTISILRDVAMNEIIFDKGSYPEVKGFYDKVKAGDEQQIILRSAANATASGN